jgi:hypothetical protein
MCNAAPTPARLAIAHRATLRASLPRSTMTAVAAQATDPNTRDRTESQARTPMSSTTIMTEKHANGRDAIKFGRGNWTASYKRT